MAKTIRRIIVLTALLPACGGDDIIGTSGDPLESDEAIAVLSVISEILAGSLFEFGPPGALAPAAAADPIDESVSLTANCPLGGTVSLSGRITGDADESRGTANVRFNLTESIRGCAFQHESIRFTINGSPNLQYDGSLSVQVIQSEFALNGSLNLKGGLSYSSSDGRSGKCGVDVRSSFTPTRVTQSGQVCGQSVSQSVSL
jgi:hypothetical protein